MSIEDDVYWFLPQIDEMIHVGTVKGWGNTKKEAKDMAVKVAKEVKGFLLTIDTSALDCAEEEIEKLRKKGINFL